MWACHTYRPNLFHVSWTTFNLKKSHTFTSLVYYQLNPDLVPKFRNQVRLMGSRGLQGGIPWLKETDQAICPLCKSGTEDLTHFLLKCSALKDEWKSFGKAYFLKLEFAAPMRLALLIYFLSILMMTQNVGFS